MNLTLNKEDFRYKLLTRKTFLLGLLIKVICASVFAGDLLTHSFIPFVTYFIDSGFSDPYQYHVSNSMPDAFPYPALMLYIFSFFQLIFGWLGMPESLLFRIPLLIADTVILIFLCGMLKGRETKILLLYWCSPVLLYISYIQGQFDALPIMFLFISFYYLFKRQLFLSAIILGLSLATKTNMVLVLPFYMVYIWRDHHENKYQKSVITFLLIAGTFILINAPYLMSSEFMEMVFKNKQQSKIWNFGIAYSGELVFFAIPALYIFLLAKFIRFNHLGKDVYMLFIGFVFTSLILFIPPMPGWYFWSIPFLIYFYAKEDKLTVLPLVFLQLVYILYFGVIPESDYLEVYVFGSGHSSLFEILSRVGINTGLIVNLAFTALQTLLLVNIYWIYKIGVSVNLKARIKNVPCLIGIGGDSGVGKSTMSASFQKLFSQKDITIITGDDMHKWERGHEMWKDHTHLSPNANRLYEEVVQMKALKNGNKIIRSIYDHDTGKFSEPVTIYSNKVILFEGLHPFYISAKRELYDVKIFMNPEESLRIHWKLLRDTQGRNYSKDKVLEQLESRKEDASKFIQPQAQYADIEVIYFPLEPIKDSGSETPIALGLKIRFGTNLDIEQLHHAFAQINTVRIDHYYEMSHQVIEVVGKIEKEMISEMVYKLIPDAEEIIENPVFEEDYKGFLQLFILYYIANMVLPVNSAQAE